MDSVILRSLPLSGSWVVPGEGVMKRRGGQGGWVFGKGLAVFGFSRPTGAAYLLGVVLMHCVGL